MLKERKPKVKFCPYDGRQLDDLHFCHSCKKRIEIQEKPLRKPRNFWEKRPDGIADNFIDEQFLQGLAHKSK